jgi:hypothetical protein
MVLETEQERAAKMAARKRPVWGEIIRVAAKASLAGLQPQYIKAPKGVESRREDGWQGMLNIARAAGEDWERRAVAALMEDAAGYEHKPSASQSLLIRAAESLKAWTHDNISRTELATRLGLATGKESEGAMRAQLHLAGLPIRGVKRDGKTKKGYRVAELREVASRAGFGKVTGEGE